MSVDLSKIREIVTPIIHLEKEFCGLSELEQREAYLENLINHIYETLLSRSDITKSNLEHQVPLSTGARCVRYLIRMPNIEHDRIIFMAKQRILPCTQKDNIVKLV